ncbi:MAG: hypothetical protein ABSC10_14165 [Candidatus Acidiferrales bacterium]|jgi:uncharacterized membrane protein
MKTLRMCLLVLALVGFVVSLVIHLLTLFHREPASEYWFVMPFLGAMVSWISAAYLSGAKTGRMGMVLASEVVKGCPTWLKSADYFFFAYSGLVFLWVASIAVGILHWSKVELSVVTAFLFFSAFSMMFYLGSFSMLFGMLFADTRDKS